MSSSIPPILSASFSSDSSGVPIGNKYTMQGFYPGGKYDIFNNAKQEFLLDASTKRGLLRLSDRQGEDLEILSINDSGLILVLRRSGRDLEVELIKSRPTAANDMNLTIFGPRGTPVARLDAQYASTLRMDERPPDDWHNA